MKHWKALIGVIMLFSGLILCPCSKIEEHYTVPVTTTVGETIDTENEEAYYVEGNLTKGDHFFIEFSLGRLSSPIIPEGAGVNIKITSPDGNVTSQFVRIKWDPSGTRLVAMDEVRGVANCTGTYIVEETYHFFPLARLAIVKIDYVEKTRHPYFYLLPVGILLIALGIILIILSYFTSTKRRLPKKRRKSLRLRR